MMNAFRQLRQMPDKWMILLFPLITFVLFLVALFGWWLLAAGGWGRLMQGFGQ